MEHRWGLRREIDRAVHLWTPTGVAAAGRLRNISISGAFVVSTLPALPMTPVRINVKPLTGEGKVNLVLAAQVIRCEPDGFAVEWSDFAPATVRALIRAARAQSLGRASGGPNQQVTCRG